MGIWYEITTSVSGSSPRISSCRWSNSVRCSGSRASMYACTSLDNERPSPLMAACRSARRAEDLRLLRLELLGRQHAPVAEVGQLGELLSAAATAAAGAADGLADVLLKALLGGLGGGDVPPAHVAAVHDQVDQRAEERHDDDEYGPQRLGPSAHLVIAEDVGEDADEQEDPGDPDEDHQHRPEHAQQRIVVREHVHLFTSGRSAVLLADGVPARRDDRVSVSSDRSDERYERDLAEA